MKKTKIEDRTPIHNKINKNAQQIILSIFYVFDN